MTNIDSNYLVRVGISFWLLLISISLIGQEKIEGPIIKDFGQTFSIPSPELLLDGNEEMKVVFDITGMSEDPSTLSSQINTIARCINMHANTGTKLDKMNIVAVFHSNGIYSILNNEAYAKRYEAKNPNAELISQLSKLGIKLYVCGQSLYSRKVYPTDLHDDINIALSAMTVLIKYQAEGHAIIKF